MYQNQAFLDHQVITKHLTNHQSQSCA